MSDDASPTLALVIYPDAVWRPAEELHPRGPHYDWRQHLRDLCKLARGVYARREIRTRWWNHDGPCKN
jgi:hypothetical protein